MSTTASPRTADPVAVAILEVQRARRAARPRTYRASRRRSWRERLLTLPWRPWAATEARECRDPDPWRLDMVGWRAMGGRLACFDSRYNPVREVAGPDGEPLIADFSTLPGKTDWADVGKPHNPTDRPLPARR